MSFTKRALKKVTIFDKVKTFITQARSQGRFLLVHQKVEGARKRGGKSRTGTWEREFFLLKC